MENSNSNGEKAQGAGFAPPANPATLENIEKWIKDDCSRAISFLTAIASDKELRMQMAIWFEGRMSNFESKANPSEIHKKSL